MCPRVFFSFFSKILHLDFSFFNSFFSKVQFFQISSSITVRGPGARFRRNTVPNFPGKPLTGRELLQKHFRNFHNKKALLVDLILKSMQKFQFWSLFCDFKTNFLLLNLLHKWAPILLVLLRTVEPRGKD